MKARILKRDREELLKFAATVAEKNQYRKGRDEALAELQVLILDRLSKFVDEPSMAVLRRFGHTRTVTAVIVTGKNRSNVPCDCEMPYHRHQCDTLDVGLCDAEFWSAEEKYHRANALYEKEIHKVRCDYSTLIHSSKTWDELLAIWPEVEQFAPSGNPGAALVALNADVISRVRADIARRTAG